MVHFSGLTRRAAGPRCLQVVARAAAPVARRSAAAAAPRAVAQAAARSVAAAAARRSRRAGVSCSASAKPVVAAADATKKTTIVDAAIADPTFSVLVEAVVKVSRAAALRGPHNCLTSQGKHFIPSRDSRAAARAAFAPAPPQLRQHGGCSRGGGAARRVSAPGTRAPARGLC
jgi:hypothetical protein